MSFELDKSNPESPVIKMSQIGFDDVAKFLHIFARVTVREMTEEQVEESEAAGSAMLYALDPKVTPKVAIHAMTLVLQSAVDVMVDRADPLLALRAKLGLDPEELLRDARVANLADAKPITDTEQ